MKFGNLAYAAALFVIAPSFSNSAKAASIPDIQITEVTAPAHKTPAVTHRRTRLFHRAIRPAHPTAAAHKPASTDQPLLAHAPTVAPASPTVAATPISGNGAPKPIPAQPAAGAVVTPSETDEPVDQAAR